MDKAQFHAFRSGCRKARQSREVLHNGRRYSVGKYGADRLDSAGCYDRPRGALCAMTLAAAADCRIRLGLLRSTRVLVGMAREYRLSGERAGQ